MGREYIGLRVFKRNDPAKYENTILKAHASGIPFQFVILLSFVGSVA